MTFHTHREDLPKMIKTVLKKTGHSRLDYIGHSMGTTMFYLMVSSFPEFRSKIRTAHLLAPVYDMKEIQGILGLQPPFVVNAFLDTLEFMGIHTMQLPRIDSCTSLMFAVILMVSGYHHLNRQSVLEIASYGPSAVTTKTVRHFFQNHCEGGTFRYT